MELADIRELIGMGHPAYRAGQIYDAIYRQRVFSLDQTTTLPAGLRAELQARADFGLPVLDQLYESADGTRRYLLRCLTTRSWWVQ